ncbi:MAG: hypothetical protein DK304_000103 [Chloroflexi bacterium]|jgi:DNA-binding YbaB/EbfC family protein|nr:MAG: hypothetical protein DK304_000103 [Chloroflexota bacterium]
MNKNILKQAQELQKHLNEAQLQLENETVEATSGGGVVSTEVNGKQKLLSIKIDPSVIDSQDLSMLEDLIIAAVNEGLDKSQKLMAERLGKITGNINIPGL